MTWNYQKEDTVYANYARSVPAVSSLPRAASWDRNLAATVNVYFDSTGKSGGSPDRRLLHGQAVRSRHVDRATRTSSSSARPGILVRAVNGRLYGRYRHSVNFWEDTTMAPGSCSTRQRGLPRPITSPTWTRC